MYPNPMQQPSPMQRPPGMMNAAPMPQPNTAVGVPTMRSMVAPSPMQASLIQQQQPPPQSSMMVRPGGSPYGVMNRATLYDKNKRSTYSNDLRQQQIIQPGQQPPMTYGNVMSSNQSMMSNAVAQGGTGPIRPQ
jgi:hypothetical protein